jgi:aminopeptidase N
MTRDGELATRDYLDMVLTGLRRESDIGVVQAQQRRLRTALDLYADPTWRPTGLARYATAALEQLRQAVPGSDHQIAWAETFAAVAHSKDHLDILDTVLTGDHGITGLIVDEDLRWTVLTRLSATGTVDKSTMDDELARDDTAAGQRRHATCVAARGTAAAKADAWAAMVEHDTLANGIQEAVITGFTQPDHRALLAPYVEKYFAAIRDVFEHRSHEMRRQLIVGLYPSLQVEPATLAATDTWLAQAEPPPALRRMVLEGRAGVARALHAQAADRATAEP